MKIHVIHHHGKTFELWYDRAYTSWFAAERVNEAGDLGHSVFAYRKDTVLHLIEQGSVDNKDWRVEAPHLFI